MSHPDKNNTMLTTKTNIGDDKKVSEAMELGTFDYLVKSSHSTSDIIAHVKEKIGL